MNCFESILENRHDYAKEWKKKTGGKVVGYYDTYFPEEVAYAAGILPVRILAEHKQDDATDRLMYGNCYCSKDIYNQFLLGDYDYIDGIVSVESCQWWYNAFDMTLVSKPNLWNHYIFTPDYTDGNRSKFVLRSELKIFRERLKEWTGKTICDADLGNAIEVYNKNRQLLRRLYQLRRLNRQVIKGSEAMTIVLASQIMDKAEANALLEQLIPQIEARTPLNDCVRLMLVGSETYDVKLEELVETLDANIVVDELDNGTAYVENDVIIMNDLLMAIALRYLGKPHSALKDNVWRRRPERIYQLYEDFQADGVLIAKQIYCHPHGSDMYMVWKLLRERNIPHHTFERDMTLSKTETALGIEALISIVKQGMVRLNGSSY